MTTSKPIMVNYWSGAMTNWRGSDYQFASFRRFVLDKETMLPKRVETYALNPNDENPSFEFHHELTELYGMNHLSPIEFDELAERVRDNEEAALNYIHTKSQKANTHFSNTCKEKCRKQAYCQMSHSIFHDYLKC